MNPKNIFSALPPASAQEFTETILHQGGMKIERIVSHGHASAPGFWYDQDSDDWVMVLRGKAKIVFENESAPVELSPGDYLDIPAGRKHRVEWTSADVDTVWLAIYY